jgi:hypothetical protein
MTWALQALPSRRYDAEFRKGLERGQYAWHGICSLVLVSLPSYGPLRSACIATRRRRAGLALLARHLAHTAPGMTRRRALVTPMLAPSWDYCEPGTISGGEIGHHSKSLGCQDRRRRG